MIPVFNKTEINALSLLLATPLKIVITTHHNPDGDAIGSVLGLYHFLVSKKHKVKVITPSAYPEFIRWMKGNEKVIDFMQKPKVAAKCFAEADLVFCLDFNDSKRVEGMEKILLQSSAKKVLIDHHLEPVFKCDFLFSFPSSCATCEIIYHFIYALDPTFKMSTAIAECIYTGIMTDTGSFRFSSMSADTHRVIAALLDTGMRHEKIHESISDTYSEERTRFLGYCLKDKMQVIQTFNCAYIALSKSEMELYHNQPGDTEGIVNYPLSISGIKMSALFTERDDCIKISFRSKGDFSVRDFSSKYFNGGGHKNASGGKSYVSLDETLEHFIAALAEYKKHIQA
jgi:phosphoesterase RecJ-like protein